MKRKETISKSVEETMKFTRLVSMKWCGQKMKKEWSPICRAFFVEKRGNNHCFNALPKLSSLWHSWVMTTLHLWEWREACTLVAHLICIFSIYALFCGVNQIAAPTLQRNSHALRFEVPNMIDYAYMYWW